MRKTFRASLLLAIVFISSIAKGQELKTAIDSLNYAIGVSLGSNLKDPNIPVNTEIIFRAIKDILGDKAIMNQQQCGESINSFFSNINAKKAEENAKIGKENKDKGEAFLLSNKSQPGVVVLPSGLQYVVIKEGTGEKPSTSDRVKVHYHGTTIDGKVFDSSVDRGEPATFGVTQVIRGWVEALQLMPAGSKWKVFVPENLAYGAQAPPAIGPNQVLVFDIELLEIVK